jgi:hypothetical protein
VSDVFNVFAGCKTWNDVRDELDRSCAVLALVKDEDALWIAKEYHNGIEDAAVAGVAALMFRKVNGAGATIEEGVRLYQKAIAIKEKATGEILNGIRSRLNNMQSLVAWSSQCHGLVAKGFKSPVRLPNWRTPEKHSGLGNIFLYVGVKGIGDGNTTDKLAVCGVVTFLKEQSRLSKGAEKKAGGRHGVQRRRQHRGNGRNTGKL